MTFRAKAGYVGRMSDVHMSRLAGWVVRQFGKALLISMAVAVAGSVIAAVTDEPGWFILGYLGAGIAFALVLATAEAPAPYTREDLGLDTEQYAD